MDLGSDDHHQNSPLALSAVCLLFTSSILLHHSPLSGDFFLALTNFDNGAGFKSFQCFSHVAHTNTSLSFEKRSDIIIPQVYKRSDIIIAQVYVTGFWDLASSPIPA